MQPPPLRDAAQRVLDCMAWLETKRIPMPWNRTLVAYLCGYRPRAGYFKDHTGRLNELRLISFPRPFHLALEEEGRLLATAFDEELTIGELHTRVLATLHWHQRTTLAPLIQAYPNPLNRVVMGEQIALGRDDLANALAGLRATGLVHLPDVESAVASAVIFPQELMQ